MFSWFGKVSFVPYSKVQDFAVHLRDGRLMASVCKDCKALSFPPRADCEKCMGEKFDFKEITGQGKVYTFSTIAAAPTGFEDVAPYTVVVVELKEGGRLLGWLGETLKPEDTSIGMDVQVVPRILEETDEIKVYYTIEKAGTTWHKAPAPHLG
jgi:uncharacterized OB-fold protein